MPYESFCSQSAVELFVFFILIRSQGDIMHILSCYQRYSTNIDSVITYRFNIKNIYGIANTASDDI